MNIFISWSGAKSREVATALRQWILSLLPSSEPWIASDLPAGVDWTREITHHIQLSRIGIICLTDENKNSPWLLFEAGALTRAGKLFLYLIDLEPREIAGPLAHFEASRADQNGTWRLIAALNKNAEEQIPEELLRNEFDRRWPELEHALVAVSVPRVETVAIVFGEKCYR